MLLINKYNIPSTIGVYIFYNHNTPIYIGKSINIKARIRSHFKNINLSLKETALIRNSTKLEWIITQSNYHALLLEAELIKKYQPKYNTIFKDDKSPIYIKITVKNTYPKVFIVRREKDPQAIYFGPFKSAKLTSDLLYLLRKIVPFCSLKNITKRSCFYSHLGLCSPCPNDIEKLSDVTAKKDLKRIYQSNIKNLIFLLNGQYDKIIKLYNKKMIQYAKIKNFEKSLIYRNRIYLINKLLSQNYTDDFNDSMLNEPKIAFHQLKTFFLIYFGITLKHNYRFECYDISNLNLSNSTGSMTVFENGMINSGQYRRFKLIKYQSDTQMLKEVILRRFKKLWNKPDLIIIDGGKPQLNIITKTLKSININVPVISIAKNPDRIYGFIPDFKPLNMKKYPLVFKIITLMRDESHRFAKKYHLLLRNKYYLY